MKKNKNISKFESFNTKTKNDLAIETFDSIEEIRNELNR